MPFICALKILFELDMQEVFLPLSIYFVLVLFARLGQVTCSSRPSAMISHMFLSFFAHEGATELTVRGFL